MRLLLDLRFDAAEERRDGDELRLGFHRIAAAARSPRELRQLLRGERYELVTVEEDDLPPSAVQAAVLVLAGLARPRGVPAPGRMAPPAALRGAPRASAPAGGERSGTGRLSAGGAHAALD